MSVCFLFLLWRAFKGFCWSDESFYISTTDRFFRGEIPLVDEWFRTQMSSLILVPFYALYVLIAGSNAGIILYFRLLYLVFSLVAALVTYRVLKKDYPDHVAVVPALFLMCYAHLNNATFSYYMLSCLFTELALILIYDHNTTKKKAELFVAGILIALGVLCMPLFAAGYALIMLALFAALFAKRFLPLPRRIKETIDSEKLVKISVYTIAGIALCAVSFMIYIFSRMDLKYLLETLPYALVDNEHNESLGYFIRKPNRCLTEVFGTYITYASYLLIAVSFLFQKILKKHPFREISVGAAIIIFILMSYKAFGHTGYMQVVFFMFMIPVYFVSEKKNAGLFWLMSVPAVLVALIYCFASSDFLYVMAIGAAIGTPAGVCALYDLVRIKDEEDKADAKTGSSVRILGIALTLVCLYALGTTFALRLVNVYRDAPVTRLTRRIPSGIAKGLYTTDEHLEMYDDVYETIDEFCSKDGGNILFSKILPWGYLATDMRCAYPTTWRATAYDKDQLDLYYKINPDQKPDMIVVLDEQYGSYDAAGDTEDDHNPNLDEMSDYWKDYISSEGFTETRVKCGKIYRRK